MAIVMRNMYKEHAQDKVSAAQTHVEMLRGLEMLPNEVHMCKEPETLEDTNRKQNIQKSLLTVNDATHDFFLTLTDFVDSHLTAETLTKYKSETLGHVRSTMESNEEIKSLWSALFPGAHKDAERTIFQKVLSTFVNVFGKQFKIDTRDKLRLQKKKAHRKHISQGCPENTKKRCLSAPEARSAPCQHNNDISDLHQKLQSQLLRNTKFFLQTGCHNITKKDLQEMCKAYALPFKQSLRKD